MGEDEVGEISEARTSNVERVGGVKGCEHPLRERETVRPMVGGERVRMLVGPK